jgi:hypothetical protein
MPWQFRMLAERFVADAAYQQQTFPHLVVGRKPGLAKGLF